MSVQTVATTDRDRAELRALVRAEMARTGHRKLDRARRRQLAGLLTLFEEFDPDQAASLGIGAWA